MSEKKHSFLTFNRKVGQYFRMGNDSKIKLRSYDPESNVFEFVYQAIDIKTVCFKRSVGECFKPMDDISIHIINYSKQYGVEIGIEAPKSIKIDRG